MRREHNADLARGGECDNFSILNAIHSDGDTMFDCEEFRKFCSSKNFSYTTGRQYKSTDQALVERFNRVVENKVRLLLHQAELPLTMFCYAVRHVAFIHNMTCTRINKDWAPPCLAVFHRIPDYSELRIWGSRGIYHLAEPQRSNGSAAIGASCHWQDRAKRGFYAGLECPILGYKQIILPDQNRLIGSEPSIDGGLQLEREGKGIKVLENLPRALRNLFQPVPSSFKMGHQSFEELIGPKAQEIFPVVRRVRPSLLNARVKVF